MSAQVVKNREGQIIVDPPIARFLFSDTRFSPVWLVVRFLLGLSWLQSGWGKLFLNADAAQGLNPKWMDGGAALKGFWESALGLGPDGLALEGATAKIKFDWYQSFINGLYEAGAYTWFAKLVVFGEVLVGLALILGLFVGIAAFFGAFLNWNFIMAGTASSNGLYIIVAVLLMLAWKTAGWYGLDRYALPYIGTPWAAKPDKNAVSPALKPQPKGA
jgi:thiosulfate dehydrogenase [quinone] large subunit